MQKFPFKTFGERLQLGSVSALSLAAIGAAGFFLFGPVTLGIAGGFGLAYALATKNKQNHNGIKVRKALLTRAEPHSLAQALADEAGQKLGLKQAPEVWLLDRSAFLPQGMPPSPAMMQRMEAQITARSAAFFSAIPGKNRIITTEDALEFWPTDMIDFNLARQTARIKTDKRSPLVIAKGIASGATTFLMIAAAFGSVATGIVPIAAIGAAVGLKLVTFLAFNAASRIRERRADRNALYVTRDPVTAIEGLERVGLPPELLKKLPRWSNILFPTDLHPKRVDELRKSFNRVSEYETRRLPPQPFHLPPQDNGFRPRGGGSVEL